MLTLKIYNYEHKTILKIINDLFFLKKKIKKKKLHRIVLIEYLFKKINCEIRKKKIEKATR